MGKTIRSSVDSENPGFTLRAAIIGVALSLFLLMSSTYISIKLGALPWPIVFSVIVSGGLIKLLNRSQNANIHEINTAQAGASIGGLVAAGIAFTVPGILYLNQSQNLQIAWPNPWLLGLLTAIAGLLGVLLSVPLKYTFVDEEQLPYPSGTAGAELLKLGKTGGKQLFFIIAVGSGAAVFALVRDVYFPTGFAISALAAIGIFLTFFPMPLGIGGGYILGPQAGFSWFLGAVVGWLVIVPLLFHKGYEPDSARAFVQNSGMGVVLGAGIGFLVGYIIPRAKRIFAPIFKTRDHFMRLAPWLALFSVTILILTGVPWLAGLLALLGTWMMVTVAARMTGETNIDPLEQFGIFTGLVIAFIYKTASLELSMYASFMIVAFVSVACAIAGDAGHDYKSASIVGTRFFDIVKVDIIAVICAGIAAPFVIEMIRDGFSETLFTPVMPAPQAQMVAGSIFGFEYPLAFITGFVAAFLLEIGERFLPDKFRHKVLVMPLGIGMFLGFGLAIPIAVGALIRVVTDKTYPHLYHAGLLIAAGVMGGEGIAGFGAGALTVLGLSFKVGAFSLTGIFGVVLLVALRGCFSERNTKLS
ncbi:hypothetical protein GWO43_09535 [candidate division KSB1 bacterium]|nr:hypothetical protein [candidate division KSB1 bacterium]NIR69410.1 hypothetical protein [candidate division KSB1 bacterium]NIS24208.1 hypothetical protein [candidate division KSB1 bacterium]NIT71122.1 hypothetical protein [candidate division KSB1 bacterium]NIU24827.1 hypothetical protein [candidate division KSB1 bacterium]